MCVAAFVVVVAAVVAFVADIIRYSYLHRMYQVYNT